MNSIKMMMGAIFLLSLTSEILAQRYVDDRIIKAQNIARNALSITVETEESSLMHPSPIGTVRTSDVKLLNGDYCEERINFGYLRDKSMQNCSYFYFYELGQYIVEIIYHCKNADQGNEYDKKWINHCMSQSVVRRSKPPVKIMHERRFHGR